MRERDGDSGSVRERKQSAKDVDCQEAGQLPIKKESGDRCIEGCKITRTTAVLFS